MDVRAVVKAITAVVEAAITLTEIGTLPIA